MRVRRLEVVDEYVDPSGESAVLVEGNVVVVSELATHLLRLVGDGWASAPDIAAGLVATFGDPPEGTDAVAMTTDALVALQEQGIVEIRSD